MMLRKVAREEFIDHITTDKADGFAKTFRSKADMGGDKYWDNCIGAYDEDGDLMGAIIVTVSVRKPFVANLQLLHTFAKHRFKGVGKVLCQAGLESAIEREAEYMRVSSEIPAIPFYKKIGFTMLGEQKSGCNLSMFKINGPSFSTGIYDVNDETIHKAVYRKGKGGCVKVF